MAQDTIGPRIGIFGGSFDPIHWGHLLIAERCREQLNLDEVRFIPAALSPLKQDRPPTDGKQRMEMVRLAIGGNPYFTADDRELKRDGPSYTVDTLRELKRENPTAQLVFLMGADSLADLDRWREPEEICRLAFVAVVARGGLPEPDLSILKRYLPIEPSTRAEEHLVHVPEVQISSTQIRALVSDGRSVRYQVTPAVAAYIDAQHVYSKRKD